MSQDQLNALVIALMPFLVSLALTLFRALLDGLPANRHAQAEQIVSKVVTAVEQMYSAMPGTNEDKKAAARKLASTMLKDHGLKISPDALNVYVESAVHAMPATAKE